MPGVSPESLQDFTLGSTLSASSLLSILENPSVVNYRFNIM
jgi:hypothetical protein